MDALFLDMKDFLQRTGKSQVELAREAGVSTASINRMVKGRQETTKNTYADAIRAAMLRLSNNESSPPSTER